MSLDSENAGVDLDGFEHVGRVLEDAAMSQNNVRDEEKIEESEDANEMSKDGVEEEENDGSTDRASASAKATRSDSTHQQLQLGRERKPTWTRMHRRHLSMEVLKTYNIDFEIDDLDSNYILIRRWVPEYEQDFLWTATRVFRAERDGLALRLPRSPAVGRYRRYSEVVDVTPATRGSHLKLDVNRISLGNWERGKSDVEPAEERGKHVLDVVVDADGNIDRVSINSEALGHELAKLTGGGMGTGKKNLLPPWKLLVEYESQIRERLDFLLKKEKTRSVTCPGETEEQPRAISRDAGDTKLDERYIENITPAAAPCEICDNVDPPHESLLECLEVRIPHLKVLLSFMDNELAPVFDLRRRINDGTLKEIAFSDLWHLFNPGDVIISSPLQRAYRIFYTSEGRPQLQHGRGCFEKAAVNTFAIHCFYMDHDEKRVGPIHETLQIPEYIGTRPISALSVDPMGKTMIEKMTICPLKMLSTTERTSQIEKLISRGKKLMGLKQCAHKYYDGPTGMEPSRQNEDDNRSPRILRPRSYFRGESNPPKESIHIRSDIIIDSSWVLDIKPLGIFDPIYNDPLEQRYTNRGRQNDRYDDYRIGEDAQLPEFLDQTMDENRASRYKDDKHLLLVRGIDEEISDDHLMLLPPTVDAFVLDNKQGMTLLVDEVRDAGKKSELSLQDLVLPEGHKDVLEALVGSHASSRPEIRGFPTKDEALTILLHGPPCIGKTQTAKALASHFNRPIYNIHLADLTASAFDARCLPEHFQRAAKWNAIVLIPDAETRFPVQERAQDDYFSAGGMFLRELQHFNGVVILTARDKSDVDKAVMRKINVSLGYDLWDKRESQEIWKKQLATLEEEKHVKLGSDVEIGVLEFAKEEYRKGMRWNGREISDCFDTAIAMMKYGNVDGEKAKILETKHFLVAARVVGASVTSAI